LWRTARALPGRTLTSEAGHRPSVIAGSVSLAAEDAVRRRRLALRAAAIVGLVAVVVVLLAVRWHSAQPFAGDEPHYLVLTNSLILDGDVDVKNDYLAGRYRNYYPFPLDPHVNSSIFKPESPH